MIYLLVNGIRVALNRVNNNSTENRTSTVTNGLLNHYFKSDRFTITPGVMQNNRKRPDFLVERIENDTLLHHVVVEDKSHTGYSFWKAADQVIDTITETIDAQGNYTIFVVLCKGIKIGFFVYHSYASLLDECGVLNYNGLVPLNYVVSLVSFNELSDPVNASSDYIAHRNSLSNIITNSIDLTTLGVETNEYFKFPCIWNLLNENHANHVHNLFQHMANNKPSSIAR